MYDDVNESLWSRATVHALLPRGCGHVPMPERDITCARHGLQPHRHTPLLQPLTHPSVCVHPFRCVRGAPTRKAYAHLRRKLTVKPEKPKDGAQQAEKPAPPLAPYFRKTYREMNGWLHLFQMFYRVYIFHAVLLHLTFAVAYAGWDWCAARPHPRPHPRSHPRPHPRPHPRSHPSPPPSPSPPSPPPPPPGVYSSICPM